MFTDCFTAVYGFGVDCVASRYCLSSAALLLPIVSGILVPVAAAARYCLGCNLCPVVVGGRTDQT